jgi:hypothetical protein
VLLRLDQSDLASSFGIENLRFDQFGLIAGFAGITSSAGRPIKDIINTLTTLTIGHPVERIGKWFNYCLRVPSQKSAQIFKLLMLVTDDYLSVPAFGLTLSENSVPDQYILHHFPRSSSLAYVNNEFVSSWRLLYKSLERNASKLNHFAFDKFIYAESKSVFNDSQSFYEHVCLQELLLIPRSTSNTRKVFSKRLAKFAAFHFGDTKTEGENYKYADTAYDLRSKIAHGKNPTIEIEILQSAREMSRKLLAEYIHRPVNYSRTHLEFISRQ